SRAPSRRTPPWRRRRRRARPAGRTSPARKCRPVAFGHVGILTVDLHLPDGSSLKSKRKELHRVKAALTRRFACAVAEVDHHDLWQRARLTLAVVGRAAGETDERISDALR